MAALASSTAVLTAVASAGSRGCPGGGQPRAPAFTITNALHTYFQVGDVRHVQVTGLEGAHYACKVQGRELTQEGPIRIEAETDRVYCDTPTACTLHDPGSSPATAYCPAATVPVR